mmetsp:Transcript_2451/g.6080  ORF Transcript_2451/g.6080 Transcript_2451/m.6080 type:complete len:315 (-) Transcript_2451:66-1010(-)
MRDPRSPPALRGGYRQRQSQSSGGYREHEQRWEFLLVLFLSPFIIRPRARIIPTARRILRIRIRPPGIRAILAPAIVGAGVALAEAGAVEEDARGSSTAAARSGRVRLRAWSIGFLLSFFRRGGANRCILLAKDHRGGDGAVDGCDNDLGRKLILADGDSGDVINVLRFFISFWSGGGGGSGGRRIVRHGHGGRRIASMGCVGDLDCDVGGYVVLLRLNSTDCRRFGHHDRWRVLLFVFVGSVVPRMIVPCDHSLDDVDGHDGSVVVVSMIIAIDRCSSRSRRCHRLVRPFLAVRGRRRMDGRCGYYGVVVIRR